MKAGAADFALEPGVPGFDVVVSNPPYVTTEEMCTVEPELRCTCPYPRHGCTLPRIFRCAYL